MRSIEEILQAHWGHASFRPLQKEVIHSVMGGKDTLALMPTGGGKSVCYQIPAVAREGIAIVISPLIALMKDQVYHLTQSGIHARAIFSGMSKREIDITMDNCIYGKIKLLYVSPERLQTDIFIERVKKMNVSLIAVDEAHCISQWGYDFRPSYLKIAALREILPETPILALTASATKTVEKDIVEKLKFKDPAVFRKSFRREKLSYSVFYEEDKPRRILKILQNVKGSSIIYVRSRRKTKEVTALLKKSGISGDYYHAGILPQKRHAKQEKWIRNENRVMVCTNAFGMGIDKPDVRTVIHLDLPDSLEAYYQEAGRAGRDNKLSYSVILYDASDVSRLYKNTALKYPSRKTIERTYASLAYYYQLAVGSGTGYTYDLDIEDLARTYELNIGETYHVLKVLEEEGILSLTDAVLMSSRVKITANRHQLYDFEIRHPELDPLIKLILRSYEGAFDHYVRINEQKLSRQLDWHLPDITRKLQKMDRAGVLNYEPAKDKPQVTFLTERMKTANLKIDYSFLKKRKKIYEAQIDSVVYYIQNKVTCRSHKLLQYFDEKDTVNCGICDICLESKSSSIPSGEFKKISGKVESTLQEPKAIRQLTRELNTIKEEKILEVVRWLMDQNKIIQNNAHELLWNKEDSR